MRGFIRWCLLWLTPGLVLLLVLVCAFAAWVVGSEPGTRWALRTAISQVDGRIARIDGTIWRGLKVGELSIDLPAADIRINDLELQVQWRDLLDYRRLHATNLSVGLLDLDVLKDAEDEPRGEPFSMPAIPFRIALDRVYLGALDLKLDGEPLLLDVRDLQAALSLTEREGQLVFQNLNLGRDGILADIEGEFRLLELADPWPLALHIQTRAHTEEPDSPLCLRHFMPELPKSQGATHPVTDVAGISSACALDLTINATGSLDDLAVHLIGEGQDLNLDLKAQLAPRAGFPLKQGQLDLALADGSTLQADVAWDMVEREGLAQDHVTGWVNANRLNFQLLAGQAVPPGMLSAKLDFDAHLLDHREPLSATVHLDIQPESRWNEQTLSGTVHGTLVNDAPQGKRPDELAAGTLWQSLRLPELKLDLRVGQHSVKAEGSLGDPGSRIDIDANVAQLAQLWPGLPGGVVANGWLGGTLPEHELDLRANYRPDETIENRPGSAPIDAHLALHGGWGQLESVAGREGWRGRLVELEVTHAGLGLDLGAPMELSFAPGVAGTVAAIEPAVVSGDETNVGVKTQPTDASEVQHSDVSEVQPSDVSTDRSAQDWFMRFGPTSVTLRLPSGSEAEVTHERSSVGPGRWETRGGVDRLVVSRPIVKELQALVLTGPDDSRGRVIVAGDDGYSTVEIVFDADWDLRFTGALAGTVELRRMSGDFIVPAEPEFPLGLQQMDLVVTATPAGPAASRINASIDITTEKMGGVKGSGTAILRTSPQGGWVVDATPRSFNLLADINDMSWVSLFTGDLMDIGGVLQADVQGNARADGTWQAQGTVTGREIRVVRIDDGVRLLDGELAARLEGDRFILEKLRFPARLRVTPDEWRTAEWVSTNPDAKDGHLTISGSWLLSESIGAVDIDLYRYPIVQRSDRYAMVTGKLTVDAPLPVFSLSGELVADAGWIDLDMLSSVPTLDSDVVVIRSGGRAPKQSAPMDVNLDLSIDLGPRFYITGYGVNSGLVGKMRLLMHEGRLTAEGALRTRGGAIEIYGQRVQLRRGTITFQGDVTNPVLNIEALRTGGAVEAGVRVAGTAKRPRIDLVSYPEVSDVQKLSWLLLGRGPDDSGGDAALLFSVGTSFLGDGEPFYRKFGIDELTMRSGELGSTGSILPVESVVRGLDSGTSNIENQFIVASRRLTEGITASIEQALSDTGTVGRLSYRLARGLSAQLSVGTVNGLALIYRTFFMD
ncbi:MAG TPA: translocation/assembly module TamB domain-containing protein [Pusillimonas sp.]|uniref:translocation/assembly module TamB domain-containing protein n=1 Tax=Pusillimonas sp. TaxID=3040095 RepID=UPI002B4B81BE|nr:translocation/assembly module TamB domain-containing protein [Pusillimonas sp.]HLU18604.1 translocation/assembly module TamB domain-containing protein [Pusillimonas sp.]